MDLTKWRNAIISYQARNNAKDADAVENMQKEAKAKQKREAELAAAVDSCAKYLDSEEATVACHLLRVSQKTISIAQGVRRKYYFGENGLEYFVGVEDSFETITGKADTKEVMAALIQSGKTFEQWLAEARKQLDEIVAAAPAT